MYFDQIKAELVEAQDVLNKFVSDDNNIKLIEKISDAVMVLKDGRVMEYGPCDRVFKAPQDAYTKTLLAAAPVLRRVKPWVR